MPAVPLFFEIIADILMHQFSDLGCGQAFHFLLHPVQHLDLILYVIRYFLEDGLFIRGYFFKRALRIGIGLSLIHISMEVPASIL